ncbi:PAAR domain-containing protein [Glaciimonas soli]|uniref:PAAR domain-containing protein n=1 Tax=Glaciimonas soli TaxID=2590999 RepID=A0A843YRC5_9BURK|nr:PAAR domain-containing protein [Glaciimonas soli]MQR02095.1 PAAR domain-containing protein [Glaciimonas soli]
MTNPIGLQGDDTDHGGQVTVVTGNIIIDGRHNARLGDWVSCPKHGDNQIIDTNGGFPDDGIEVALHGSKTECGSVVIASSKANVSY